MSQSESVGKSTLTHKLLRAHLVSGELEPGAEIGIRIDHTLTQDATGTMVYLEFAQLGLDRVRTELSVSYVDHNLLQTDFRNADDHRFLQSSAARYGVWFSRPGNGVCHQVHLERFGAPGKTMLGSDSHTPTGGGLGMLAIGAGGLEVALAMAGEPFHLKAPQVFGVKLTGELLPWVSAKDVILEMLRRHSVKGGVGKVIEYYGPGVAALSVPDRAVIANMGAELGATSTVWPSDERTREFLRRQGREDAWTALAADLGAQYDQHDEIDLAQLEPLIAMPSMPDKVVTVRQAAGTKVHQVLIGSCANSGLAEMLLAAEVLNGKHGHPEVSLEINPGSRQVELNLAELGALAKLVAAGARLHQCGCLGCIGMGQAPASGTVSLRTFPRNFAGRSGTVDDSVYLCSPQTALAAALAGEIRDPRELGEMPRVKLPKRELLPSAQLIEPPAEGTSVQVVKGPNIVDLPQFAQLPELIDAAVMLKLGDDVTTDQIIPAGNLVLPLRSNLPAISEYTFSKVDHTFAERMKKAGSGLIVGGLNYGQGSSREHAALTVRYLGVAAVIARSFARIHWQNLVNFGVLPLTFTNPEDHGRIESGDRIEISDLRDQLKAGSSISARNASQRLSLTLEHSLSTRQVQMLLDGGLLNYLRKQKAQ
ncbi:MAG: aconitate hydratase [Candidatus Alcyoniella australis]|nr:aconitate hydratase [Candidatus Alcyoniella australis]